MFEKNLNRSVKIFKYLCKKLSFISIAKKKRGDKLNVE